MNSSLRLAAIGFCFAAAAQAAPFMAIGDGAEVFLTGTLGIRSDDNILLGSGTAASPEEEDIIFDITPGAELTFGKDAQMSGALSVNVAISSYADNSRLNTELFSSNFRSSYDDGKLKMAFNAGFAELNQNTVDVRGLTRRDVFNAGGNAEVEVSQITSVGVGLQFNREDYKPRGYTDSDSLTVPVDFFYKWTPKTDLSVGYRYRDYQVDTLGSDSNDHFFNVGARGEFTPKLTGRFAVGVNQRRLDRGGDDTGLGLDASFTYEFSPKTSLRFGASNDFATSPQGQQQENFSINAGVDTKLSEEWSINAGLSFRATDYGTRTDDFIEARIGTSYIVNANLRIVGAYQHSSYSTVQANSDFKSNIFSVAANFRY